MRKIAILGSTGSIGVAALKVINELGNFKVTALSANNSIALLNAQSAKHKPLYAVLGEQSLKNKELVRDADIVLIAVVGAAGLFPLINSIKLNKRIALANKESLVIAGGLINRLMAAHNAEIIPVDSEHSAIFQCLQGSKTEDVSKIILTASGGPFREYSTSAVARVTVQDVLKHPTWKMGRKITVDSATMMNKGLEVIEAHYLFGLPYEKIEVLIHPQSIVHSAVEFVDGSIIAQMGRTDMRLPIQYALTYPERLPSVLKKISLSKINRLEFFQPVTKNFPCFELAMFAAKTGGSMPVVLNAANEVAVNKFLKNRIGFTMIPKIIEKALKRHSVSENPGLEEILNIDADTREYAEGLTGGN